MTHTEKLGCIAAVHSLIARGCITFTKALTSVEKHKVAMEARRKAGLTQDGAERLAHQRECMQRLRAARRKAA